jgi:hypothetical protein
MPIQRGKRNKKPRRRGTTEFEEQYPARPMSSTATPVKNDQGRRRRWQPPLWVNALLGVGMIIFGIIVFAMPQKGAGQTQRLIFLVLYFLIAALYLGKAYQQYRVKQRG